MPSEKEIKFAPEGSKWKSRVTAWSFKQADVHCNNKTHWLVIRDVQSRGPVLQNLQTETTLTEAVPVEAEEKPDKVNVFRKPGRDG